MNSCGRIFQHMEPNPVVPSSQSHNPMLSPLAPLAPQRHLRGQNPRVHRRTCATLDVVKSSDQEYLRHIWKIWKSSSREHAQQINGLWWCMSQNSDTQTMRSGTCYHHWCLDSGVIMIWARANYHCGSCCGNLLQLAKCQARQGNWFRFVVAHAKRFKEVGGFSKYLATIAQQLHFVPRIPVHPFHPFQIQCFFALAHPPQPIPRPNAAPHSPWSWHIQPQVWIWYSRIARTQHMSKPTIAKRTLGEIHNDKHGFSHLNCNANRIPSGYHPETQPRKQTLQICNQCQTSSAIRKTGQQGIRSQMKARCLSLWHLATSRNARLLRLLHFGGLSWA